MRRIGTKWSSGSQRALVEVTFELKFGRDELAMQTDIGVIPDPRSYEVARVAGANKRGELEGRVKQELPEGISARIT